MQLTEEKEAWLGYICHYYLRDIKRHIINKFDCRSSSSLRDKGVHTDTQTDSYLFNVEEDT